VGLESKLMNDSVSSRPFPPKEHGGLTCLLASRFSRGCAARQVAASTIRRPSALFNRQAVGNRFSFRTWRFAQPFFIFPHGCCVQSPAWAISAPRHAPRLSLRVMRHAKAPVRS